MKNQFRALHAGGCWSVRLGWDNRAGGIVCANGMITVCRGTEVHRCRQKQFSLYRDRQHNVGVIELGAKRFGMPMPQFKALTQLPELAEFIKKTSQLSE